MTRSATSWQMHPSRQLTRRNPGWTRTYAYNEPSLLEPGKQSNRLSSTTIGRRQPDQPEQYGYDAHGNMLRMPHLPVMQWDFKDQLQMTQRQAVNADDEDGVQHQGERTYYVYDAGGQRVRKVTERQTAAGQTSTRERAHLPRRLRDLPRVRTVATSRTGARDAAHHGRQAAHRPGGDAHRRAPQAPTVRRSNSSATSSATTSARPVLELDDQAQIISYEEYTPYGSTSYQAVRSQTETPKRYRYTGKERDEESGLDYHGARYYAPWLGRWTNTDAIKDSLYLYQYAENNPIVLIDTNGLWPKKYPPEISYLSLWERAKSLWRKTAVIRYLAKIKTPLPAADVVAVYYPSDPPRPTHAPPPPDPKTDMRGDIVRNDQGGIEGHRIRGPEATAEQRPTPPPPPDPKTDMRGDPVFNEQGGIEGHRIRGPGDEGGGGGKFWKAAGIVSAFAVLAGKGSTAEKAKTLAVGYGIGNATELAAGLAGAAELAGPLGFVLFMPDDQGATYHEAQAKLEAQQAFLEELNGRAAAIFIRESGKGYVPEWNFVYEEAVHEKYVELGLDKVEAAQQKARKEMLGDPNPNVCSKYDRARAFLDLGNPAPMYAR